MDGGSTPPISNSTFRLTLTSHTLSKSMSKSNDAVRAASSKGYVVTEAGDVISRAGKLRKLAIQPPSSGRPSYMKLSIKLGDQSFPVPVHKLQAYQKFGEKMFEPGIVVRHLDGNSLNNTPDNINIGTQVDNALDRPNHERQTHAEHAASHNIAYDWIAVENDYAGGMGFSCDYFEIQNKFGVTERSCRRKLGRFNSNA